jgi:hypothetical protein
MPHHMPYVSSRRERGASKQSIIYMGYLCEEVINGMCRCETIGLNLSARG